MPIYGSQFHPEKNQFEWTTTEMTPHTQIAISTMHYFMDFFVSEARKSPHVVADAEKELIYNYSRNIKYYPNAELIQLYYW